ncbi:MAG TPA: hypothetical protein VNA16_00990 [Abditibacteriaceae bacterium]|nr:hypothetical protein [Abditibacteriaceae bacterium]
MNCSICGYAMDPLDTGCPKCAIQNRRQDANPSPPQAAVPATATAAPLRAGSTPPPAVGTLPGTTPPGATPPPQSSKIADFDGDIIDDDKVAATRRAIKMGVGLLAVVVIGFFVSRVVLGAMQPQSVEAPTAFTSFTAGDKSFTCDAPADWDNATATLGGGGVTGNATFKKGAVRIDVKSDLAGSLWGDISRVGSAEPGVPQKSPVQKVHEMSTEAMSKKFTNYEEMPGTMYQSKLGETWMSEFTADGGFGVGKLHGYRVTMLGGERRYTVLCQCPAADWDKLKPAFDRIRDSLTPTPS